MLTVQRREIIEKIMRAAKKTHETLGQDLAEEQYSSQLVAGLTQQGLRVQPLEPPSIYERLETIQIAHVPTLLVENHIAIEIVVKDEVYKHDIEVLEQYLLQRQHMTCVLINFGGQDIRRNIFVVDAEVSFPF